MNYVNPAKSTHEKKKETARKFKGFFVVGCILRKWLPEKKTFKLILSFTEHLRPL